MKIIDKDFEKPAKRSIKRWGNCEEHNYVHFLSLGTSAKDPVFISFEDDMGILALRSKTGKIWYVVREVLAPEEKKSELFLKFADHIMNKLSNDRLEVELNKDSKDKIDVNLHSINLRACRLNFYLEWPLFYMKEWDGDIMPGKSWKKLRNIKNRFYKEHKVEVKHPKDVDKKELKRIVKEWKKKRNAEDFAYHQEYLNNIDHDFAGFDEIRVLVVDDIPRAITAGWKIPNSNDYYSSLGVLDYSIDRLGEIANLDDLTYLKSRGYSTVNFGGSDEDLLDFKNKFKPHSKYNTYTYSIMKKGELRLKKTENIDECKRLFNKFSTKKTVWDIWDIAYSFTRGYNNKPLFIFGVKDGKEIGVLHIEKIKDVDGEEMYDFFGGNYPERRTFFVEDKSLLKDFFCQIPDYASFGFIDPSEKDSVKGIKKEEATYMLDLEKLDYDIENYFKTFNKKHRKNIKYDLKKLEKLEYHLEWNKKEYLQRLAELNIMKFKGDSNFKEPEFQKSMEYLLEAADKLDILHMLSIKIGTAVEASQIALFYNDVYYVLTGGSNPEIKNLGKLLIAEHIKNAARLKAKTIDFMSTESGWKELWNLEKKMLYKYEHMV